MWVIPKRCKIRTEIIHPTTDKNHITLVSLYGSNAAAASPHTTAAELLRNGILDLLWDPNKVRYYSLFIYFEFIITYFLVHHSLRFMISILLPTVAILYLPLQHFILSGLVFFRIKLPMTKDLHLELSHLSTW